MATNTFLEFDSTTVNLLTDAAYATDAQRQAGMSGVAKSELINKVLRQSSTIAYAIGEFIKGQNIETSDANAVTLASAYVAALHSYGIAHFLDINVFDWTCVAPVVIGYNGVGGSISIPAYTDTVLPTKIFEIVAINSGTIQLVWTTSMSGGALSGAHSQVYVNESAVGTIDVSAPFAVEKDDKIQIYLSFSGIASAGDHIFTLASTVKIKADAGTPFIYGDLAYMYK